MCTWLRKLFCKKDNLDMEEKNAEIKNNVNETPAKECSPVKRKHKLEIQLYEADYEDVPEGSPPKWRPVNMGRDSGKPIIVEVADKKELVELQQRYALCDQKMRIIREIDAFDDDSFHSQKNQIPRNNQAIPVNSYDKPVKAPALQADSQHIVHADAVKIKPKIITIGDMQVKYDGDKVYQKQWVKLNSNEAANFRIVNDSNNKIVSLNGKHIECKRWVIVEEDSSESEEDPLNGIGD